MIPAQSLFSEADVVERRSVLALPSILAANAQAIAKLAAPFVSCGNPVVPNET
jgi:hypothetical protein